MNNFNINFCYCKIQIDGEPVLLPPGEININLKNQAFIIKETKSNDDVGSERKVNAVRRFINYIWLEIKPLFKCLLKCLIFHKS